METVTKRKLSIEEYHRMAEVCIIAPDEKVELIDREIIEMNGSPSGPFGKEHLATVGRINMLLTPLLAGKSIVFSQSPVQLADKSEPEIDLMIVPHRDDYYANTGVYEKDVLLVIEVSDTTLKKDLQIKLPLYALSGIPEVWIVEIKIKKLLQFTDCKAGKYQQENTYSGEDRVHTSQLPINFQAKDLIG